jgi:uncharacterized protein (TIGR02145 family)
MIRTRRYYDVTLGVNNRGNSAVQINTQVWTAKNYVETITPMGNVIPEMQTNAGVERVINGDFTIATGWTSGTGWTIGSGVATAIASSGSLSQNTAIPAANKYFKVTYTISTYTSGSVKFQLEGGIANGTVRNSAGTFTDIVKSTAAGALYIVGTSFTGVIDNVSVQELGWKDSTVLYDGLITQGYTVANATKEAAMWCYYSNDPALGAIYGRLYNWYAVSLLNTDIVAYNTANPGSLDFKVPLLVDYTPLKDFLGFAAVAGGNMKAVGLTYWNTPNTGATNIAGFTSLGAGWRRDDTGTFINFGNHAKFWVAEATKAIATTNASAALDTSSSGEPIIRGYSLRLLKV